MRRAAGSSCSLGQSDGEHSAAYAGGREPDSRRPRNVRRPQRETALVEAVLAQRTAPPWFGKDKPSCSGGAAGRSPHPPLGEAFEEACKEPGILLFVLPPHSPKLNGHVERAHRTHVDEFSDFYDGALTMGPLNRVLREWEAHYNGERPHQFAWLVESDGISCGAAPEGGLLTSPRCLICMGRPQALANRVTLEYSKRAVAACGLVRSESVWQARGREGQFQHRFAVGSSEVSKAVAEDVNRLFVGNIPFRMTQDELYDLFAQAGGVASVHIPTDRETGRPRGFGFVQMDDEVGKDQAVQMFNGYSVSGRALVVNEARPREPRF